MWFGMTLKQKTPVQKPVLKAFPRYAQSSFILAVLYWWQGPLLETVSLNVELSLFSPVVQGIRGNF